MKKMLVLMSSAIIAGTLALASDAATVSITGVTGTWAVVNPSNVSKLSGLNTNTISWGKPASATGKSAYEFDAAGPMNGLVEDTGFDLGTFIHKNNPITGQSITSATLQVAIHLLIGTTEEVINATFAFSHWETTNKPPVTKKGPNKGKRICADGGQFGKGANINGCADRVQLSLNSGASTSFIYDGDQYDFLLTGFDGSFGDVDTLWTKENALNRAGLLGRYTVTHLPPPPPPPPSPVPLPAAGFMLFTALFGMGALARKRRSV